MKIDYCSDTHFDFWFNPSSSMSENKLNRYIERLFGNKQSDTLIIAGDIGHYPNQNVHILQALQKHGYKNILVVLGNHDYYSIGSSQKFKFNHYKKKVDYTKELYREEGITVLDGTKVEIDGIVIGGADSWYDGALFYRQAGWCYGPSSVESYWKQTMNDSVHIMGLNDFYDIVIEEKEKIKSLHNQVDVMVTHVRPVIENRFFQEEFKSEKSNCFYSFDYIDEIMRDEKLKYWIAGHSHEVSEYDLFGQCKLMFNAFGYSLKDNPNAKVRTIEI